MTEAADADAVLALERMSRHGTGETSAQMIVRDHAAQEDVFFQPWTQEHTNLVITFLIVPAIIYGFMAIQDRWRFR